MADALNSLLHELSVSTPPFQEKDLRKLARVCHFNRAAVAKALEGIRGKRFHMLCDYVARMGITTSEDDTSKLLFTAAALLLSVAAVQAVQAVFKRYNLTRKCRHFGRTLRTICRREWSLRITDMMILRPNLKRKCRHFGRTLTAVCRRHLSRPKMDMVVLRILRGRI